jgi:tRNA threonylcarbamoyladenosine biosynthesis protein TsaB
MWLLAVDTSSKSASVALLRDAELVAGVAPASEEQHSVQLFRSIQQALAQADLPLAGVDVYAVANGPGAFTALRVGLTVVKGLAEMHAKPVVAVSVLEAVAASAVAEGLLVPIVDAYRGQVFGGVYEKRDGRLARRRRERVMTMEEFVASLAEDGVRPEACAFVSPQMSRWENALAAGPYGSAPRESVSPVLAESVARCAAGRIARGETLDALHLEANYVRRSDAELLWKPK